jgi:D-threo-aldose 1-dehydrogenase
MNSRTTPPDEEPAQVPTVRRLLRRRSLSVPTIGFGAAAIGNLYAAVDDQTAQAAIEEALRRGIRYFDTAPYYGYGLSEDRLGSALAGARARDVVISTKVGRLIVAAESSTRPDDGFAVSGRRAVFDYSRDGVLRSFEDSLRRLRRDRVDILLLHDIGRETHRERHEATLRQALEGALPCMEQLRSSGACRAIGIGVNEIEVCLEIMPRFDLDCILLAGRYTLLEPNADSGSRLGELLAEARRRDVGILIGGPFNSGLLAGMHAPGATYDYRPADPNVVQRAARIYATCREAGVDVGAAALQFPLAHPAVVSVIAGMRSPEEVASTARRVSAKLPASLWDGLRREGLLGEGVPTP